MNLWKGRASAFLVVIPLVNLAYGAISWLRFGIDLPFQDDWGDYRRGTAGSFALQDLFRPANDTIYPVGKFLDAAAQHLLDGNSVTYQLLSMAAVLGALLFLQWRLLRLVFDDRLMLALSFALTIFMLQPDTYWGRQNMSYHQAIPLFCILAALWLALEPGILGRWRFPFAFLVSLIAGFSYISGAVAMLAVGLVLTILGRFIDEPAGRQIRSVGLAVLAGAAIAVPAQLWVILGNQGGQTHRADAPWTFPYEADFWLFLFGIVARSLLLPKKYPIAGIATAAAICAALALIGFWFCKRLWQQRVRDLRMVRLGLVFVAIGASVAAYLCIVSAGRAGLRSDDIDGSAEVFVSGYRRFYFAWVTLIWPWLAAFVLALGGSTDWSDRHRSNAFKFAAAMIVLACAGGIVAGAFSHAAHYAKLNRGRVETQVKCLEDQIRVGAGILCPRLHPGDLAGAYVYGGSIGASFTRRFPLPSKPMGAAGSEVLFRLSSADSAAWQSQHGEILEAGPEGVLVQPSADSILAVQIKDAHALRACVHLQVALAVSVAAPGHAQVLYRSAGAPEADEKTTQSAALAGGGGSEEIYLHAASSTGFEPALKIKLFTQQSYRIKEAEIRCILRIR